MFQTAAGIRIPFPEKIFEEYMLSEDRITLNISFENLSEFVQSFYSELSEPLFLAIHPDADDFDTVYYLDQMPKKYLQMILDGYGELLYHDGLSSFAIASHETGEEIFIQKYKVVSIYSPNIKRFLPLLERFGISKTSNLVTPWDTFTQQNPGEATALQIGGKTIADMVEDLKQIGMYQAT